MEIDSVFIYHFVDLDLRVELSFKKEGPAENGDVDFEIRDIGTSAHLFWRLKKTSCRACMLFYYSFGDKKLLIKAFSTRTFILSSLNSLYLLSYSSKLRKILRLLKLLKR